MNSVNPKRIVVLGGGFAGLWSAAAAARELDRLGIGEQDVAVTLVNRDAWHAIRVRNYECDLSAVRVRLDDVLAPIGVERVEADVMDIDVDLHRVGLNQGGRTRTLDYDRLVFALGSRLVRPEIAGLAEQGFDVDTFDAAARLDAHLRALPAAPASPGRYTVLVVGAGLTGIEVATEMTRRLGDIVSKSGVLKSGVPETARVILADHQSAIGADMGDDARPEIERALRELGVETRTGVAICAVDARGATLADGETIAAATVVWCAGMRADPLTRFFPVERDGAGRLPVDATLRVQGVEHVFAAGDVASCPVDDTHRSVMSCQFARPMGRFAGHNAVCDLLGEPLLPLRIDRYVTVLDLGPAGAVYTQGWNRNVVATGDAAKKTKQLINRERIYPPRSCARGDILAAAAPVVQDPPQRYRA